MINRGLARSATVVLIAGALLAVTPSLASAAPGNDNYPGYTIPLGSSGLDAAYLSSEDTTTASVQSGETTPAACISYKTVWYRFTPPVTGHVVVQASGYDAVIVVYPNAGSSMPTSGGTCYNDYSTNSELDGFDLTGGVTYAIQVGSIPPAAGTLEFLFGFFADRDLDHFNDDTSPVDQCRTVPGTLSGCPDVDHDGFSPLLSPKDCNDNNSAVRPGASEPVNGGVDYNCDGSVYYDRDHDGAQISSPDRSFPGKDCNDSNGHIRPGAVDIPFNRIDDNCDNAPPAVPRVEADLSFPFSYQNVTRSRFITARKLTVTQVTRGARITVSCKKRGRRICRGRARASFAADRTAQGARTSFSIRALRHKRLPSGTVIEVRVTKAGYVGKYVRYKVGPGTLRKRTRCTNPGSKKPRKPNRCITAAY